MIAFPGASFNSTLLERVHEVIAAETRATGADVGYAPEVRGRVFNSVVFTACCILYTILYTILYNIPS